MREAEGGVEKGTKDMAKEGSKEGSEDGDFDLEGGNEILQRLSFVPKRQSDPLQIVKSRYSAQRCIEVALHCGSQPYGPRHRVVGGEYVQMKSQKRFHEWIIR